VSYEFYVDGEYWNGRQLAKSPVLVAGEESYGVVAVQLVGDRELRVEAFPGLKPEEVEGFSGAELTYVRWPQGLFAYPRINRPVAACIHTWGLTATPTPPGVTRGQGSGADIGSSL
jgi:hypothetical protein